jgi:hypothetical protein
MSGVATPRQEGIPERRLGERIRCLGGWKDSAACVRRGVYVTTYRDCERVGWEAARYYAAGDRARRICLARASEGPAPLLTAALGRRLLHRRGPPGSPRRRRSLCATFEPKSRGFVSLPGHGAGGGHSIASFHGSCPLQCCCACPMLLVSLELRFHAS